MKLIKRLIISVLLFVFSNLILVSLISFNFNDSSIIFRTTSDVKTSNLIGWFGAQLSSLLLYFFGSSAFLFIPILYFISFLILRYESLKNNIDRILALFFLVPIFSALSNLYTFEIFPQVCPGGTIGILLSNFLFSIFDPLLVSVFLFTFLWVFIVIIDKFSLAPYLMPLGNLLKAVPFRSIFSFLGLLIYITITALKNLLIWFIDKLTSDEFENENLEIQKIYEDPFWDLYTKEKKKIDQSVVVPHLYKKEEENIEFNCQGNSEDEIDEEESREKLNNYDYVLPDLSSFTRSDFHADKLYKQEAEKRAQILEHKLERFGIQGKVVSITHGPVVTLFEYQPSIDTKISTILAREDDLALALQALSLRIIAPIPGRSVIGFEVAHSERRSVLIGDLIDSEEFKKSQAVLPLILGKDTISHNIIIDLVAMPHLLVAGSTGSGKSVCLNTMLVSLLCAKTPDELRLILIDPKRLEFTSFSNIAHLLFPIVTEPTKALMVLKWTVKTMEERYSLMAEYNVRNIAEFRSFYPEKKDDLPYIVIVIDELADLMMTTSQEAEQVITRLAQMSRAAGIHLIIATQRPSVDVITGLIKVNFPSRIAFKVTSKIDSRIIIDTIGAEKLLGKGDMLFLDPKGGLNRVHGAYVSDKEIQSIVRQIKMQREVQYEQVVVDKSNDLPECEDELYNEILEFIDKKNEISISLIQRVFRIGYNRSARIVEKLELDGYILPADGSKMRKVVKDR